MVQQTRSTRRFSSPGSAERDAVEDQWKILTTRQFDEYELEEFDKRLADFNSLRTVKDLERYYVHVGAARWGYPPNQKMLIYFRDKENPAHLCIDRVDNKISQWSDWRRKKFPLSRINDYAKMARETAQHARIDGYDLGELASEFPEEKPLPKIGRNTLTRSGLNRYFKNHGQHYQIPEGTTVIEDEEPLSTG